MKNRNSLANCLAYALLFILPVTVYYAVGGNQFMTAWDDGWMVFNRHTYGGITLHNLSDIYSETNNGQYSPVNQTIYTALYSLFGMNPRPFHLVSLLWHVINVFLVYAFTKKLLGLREKENIKPVSITAFFTAVLFAIHPINVESIAWISASKIPVYTLFGLSALICYMQYVNSGRKRLLATSFFLFILSFGCKEQASVLPLALPLIDRFAGRNFRDKKMWLEKIPFLVFVLVAGVYTMSLRNHAGIQYLADYPLWQRLFFASYSITEYLIKLAVPVKLLYLYPFPMVPGDDLPLNFYIYPFIVAAMVGAAIYYRKHKLMVFGALFFLLNIFFTLHIVSMSRICMFADRYVYLSGIGFFIPVVRYCVKYFLRLSKHKKIIVGIMVSIYLLYLAGYAMKRVEVWHDNKSLRKEIIELLDKREPVKNDVTK